jgi:hypothetical protein
LHHTNPGIAGSIGRLDMVYCLLSTKYQAFHDPLSVRRKFNIGDLPPASRRLPACGLQCLDANLSSIRLPWSSFTTCAPLAQPKRHRDRRVAQFTALNRGFFVSVKQEVLELHISN